jgi:cytochrome c oxidase subunit 3
VDTVKMTAPASPARTGVWIGVATITMSFAAYTSALLVRQGAGSDWQHFRLPPILYFNTVVLLLSSGTIELGRRRNAWLICTLGLGSLFIAGQVLAWRNLAAQGLFLATNPSSSFFYVFTVLHALHLLGGMMALGYVLVRVRAATGGPPLTALGAVSLYWHFMDVLWLYLLMVLALRL